MDIRGDLGGPGGEAQDTSIMQYAETIHILEILSENLPVRRSCWELGGVPVSSAFVVFIFVIKFC